ncbi:OLC1v1018885C1 [Oldenlandia corymbosa var. corymbosa]|uniref:OLC1v1018885C1 n=1 Tax=Oldenlandia corymbosa var. corymbosa TaxID=529605 RepID=A0AAV1ECR3_OLDCO|nr:OLC1v1018885C1 [Oldenlandia corymbosa var. corymbosa]
MKHFMQPRNTTLKEISNESPSFCLAPNSLPNPSKQRTPMVTAGGNSSRKRSKENASPSEMNQAPMDYTSQGEIRRLVPSPMSAAKVKSPLPPRPPIKRKLSMEASGSEKAAHSAAGSSADSGVRVIVRMRPLNRDEEEGEMIVQKVSNDSLSISGHTFTFDSIADFKSRQIDIFELVGAPLVENCLAGFNSSVFAYGQTGSGKTYTVWGPAKALEENLSNDEQGLTPRVFQRLFERINEEQTKHADRQLVYQCRCSFLEIYNEQITDLLDPSQKNLLLREDVKTGVYVENLTEEYVYTMKDVTQLLIKGLSNRRTGSTSINADSSRSHSVFTCVVQSRCKSMSDGLNYLKTSRINLVDLAGSERQKLTGAAGDRLKEAGNINRSLSQLGNLINILAEVSQTGKQRHIPYRDSKLTFLLQESLGGNAKLAMICAISPSQRCKSETFSTLRFAQRAKAIKNKATINEEMPDDVNELREVIRQLKDELLRMKSNSNQAEVNGTNSKLWNARRSLNLLKFSLNRPMTLPQIDDDSDEEMEIVQQDEPVSLQPACNNGEPLCETSKSSSGAEPALEDTDVNMEEVVEQIGKDENEEGPAEFIDQNLESEEPKIHVQEDMSKQDTTEDKMEKTPSSNNLEEGGKTTDLSLVPFDISPILKSPPPSTSPTVTNSSRKSLRTSTMVSASHKDLGDDKLELVHPCLSFAKPSNSICLDLSSKRTRNLRSTQHLAASLQRGLEILDGHHQSGSIRRSSFRNSYALHSKAIPSIAKVDVGIQTLPPETTSLNDHSSIFLCSKCKNRNSQEASKDENDCSNLQLVPIEESLCSDKIKSQVPKAVEKVLAGAIRREMALEEMCAKQSSEIMHLNRLVQQYKHERECNAIISQTREDKIFRLESLMDGILSTEEFKDEELLSLTHEHKLLKEKYENHPEILRTKIELKRVQDDLQRYRNFFDLGERDVLLEEIQDLRNQLQFYVDSSPKFSRKKGPLLQLTYSCQPSLASNLCTARESNEQNAEQRFEQERIQWAEAEGKWISVVENLRTELEASQTLLQKERQELVSEKKCSEELKEAMQLAMEGHARMLEQYAELEEKHIELLAKHRSFQDGVEDIKKAAARAGVRGAESKFINALAAEISALRVDREKERRYFKDEIKGLQAQLRDTAEAVEAAGELLVRLKEAEEAIAAAENRAIEAEREMQMAYKLKDTLVNKHEEEIRRLRQLCGNSNPSEEVGKFGCDEPTAVSDDIAVTSEQWREEFAPYYVTEDGESSHLEPSSWFTGYDRCNI